jgi:hypothetical protein
MPEKPGGGEVRIQFHEKRGRKIARACALKITLLTL